MHCGLQLVASLQACEVHAVNFGAGEQASLLTVVLGSVMAQKQTNSIEEGFAAAQQGLQGPHQPQTFRRKGETWSFKKVWFEPWLHYRLCFLFL